MAVTLEAANKARESMGLPPLEKLPDANKPAADDSANKEGQEGKQNEAITPDANQQNSTDKNNVIDDNSVLEYLKSKGITYSSLDELKPKQEQKTAEQIAEERENNKISYGLQKGLFNKKEYDSFVADSASKEDVVYSQYAADAKKDDPTLTDEEIQEEFSEKYGLSAKPGSRKHKRGQQEIDLLSDMIMRTRHKKIFAADSSYEQYEANNAEETQRQKLFAEKTPVYAKDVNDIIGSLKKIPLKFSDAESYEVDLLENSIEDIKSHLMKPEIQQRLIEDGYTKEELQELAFNTMLRKNFLSLINEVSTQKAKKSQAGARGIIDAGNSAQDNKTEKPLTDNQKKALEMFKGVADQTKSN